MKELESRLQSSYAVVKRNLETAKLDNKRLVLRTKRSGEIKAHANRVKPIFA
jgi:hypothetical protein